MQEIQITLIGNTILQTLYQQRSCLILFLNFIHGKNVRYLSVYVMITTRPLFEGHATPRRLSELTDSDDDDTDKNEKTKNVHFTSWCDVRVRTTTG